ncbi:MAG TPA: PilZ domain-containing protein [Burkholderiales bacterium]|nr:PilZ domain-containing protein [Burkholderiales bacterium]
MAAMKGRELRAEARIPVKEKASLRGGVLVAAATAEDGWFPCVVQDMSDTGFLILCSKEVSVGQILEFRCQLFPEKTLNCKIQVRHVSSNGMGTKVVEIDSRGSRLVELYLEEQYSLRLNNKT